MNIFVTSPDPYECARNLDDKRVVKMVLETAQILSTVMSIYGDERAPYKPTHQNHPCTKWAAEGMANFTWLLDYFDNLCTEYWQRYGRQHKCAEFHGIFWQYATELWGILEEGTTPSYFINCTPYKDEPDVFKAYQMCLADKWENDKRTPTWYGEGR